MIKIMKNTIYFLMFASLYFLSISDCNAQFNPVNYDLFIMNDDMQTILIPQPLQEILLQLILFFLAELAIILLKEPHYKMVLLLKTEVCCFFQFQLLEEETL